MSASSTPVILKTWTLSAPLELDNTIASARSDDPVNATLLLDGAIALLYAPDVFRFGRVRGGKLEGPDAKPIDVTSVFEARCFTPSVELRWLATKEQDVGRAVLLAELGAIKGVGAPFASLEGANAHLEALATITTYVLWGRTVKDAAWGDWCILAESRIGALTVPLPMNGESKKVISAGQRLGLRACEYVRADPHGNAFVAEERLMDIIALSTSGR